MHEASIVYSAIEIIENTAKENNINNINRVTFNVGDLSGASIEALEFAFKNITKDTILENSNFIINRIEAKAKCSCCNIEFKVDRINRFCPKCDNYSGDIISGYELAIDSIDGE
jgi:hydrogenase nickel incorporation protein HypA/HybF